MNEFHWTFYTCYITEDQFCLDMTGLVVFAFLYPLCHQSFLIIGPHLMRTVVMTQHFITSQSCDTDTHTQSHCNDLPFFCISEELISGQMFWLNWKHKYTKTSFRSLWCFGEIPFTLKGHFLASSAQLLLRLKSWVEANADIGKWSVHSTVKDSNQQIESSNPSTANLPLLDPSTRPLTFRSLWKHLQMSTKCKWKPANKALCLNPIIIFHLFHTDVLICFFRRFWIFLTALVQNNCFRCKSFILIQLFLYIVVSI